MHSQFVMCYQVLPRPHNLTIIIAHNTKFVNTILLPPLYFHIKNPNNPLLTFSEMPPITPLQYEKVYAKINYKMRRKHGMNTKNMIVILSSLALLIILLVIIIVAVFIIKNKEYNLSDDNLAKDCLQNQDDAMHECIEDKAWSYFQAGDCEKALKVYDDIPADRFDKYTLSDFYDEAYSLSLSCEDESLQNYWLNKFESLSNQLEGRD